MTGRVSVQPLRERFISMRAKGEVTAWGLARELGWYRNPTPAMAYVTAPAPDARRVARTLGIAGQTSRGRSYYRERINYDLAERLCVALNVDPWEVGV